MTKIIEKIATWLKLLDVEVNVDKFESRIKIQKLTYLFGKLFGNDLYNDFRFHTRGPYSKSLEVEYYTYKTAFGKIHSIEMSKKESEEIERLKLLNMNTVSSEILEIMASLFWLEENEHFDEERAIEELIKRKPYLKLQEVIRGLNVLKSFMLSQDERKKLMKIAKSEIEPFEKASMSDLDNN
jgi:uncharacterized protein YwgA